MNCNACYEFLTGKKDCNCHNINTWISVNGKKCYCKGIIYAFVFIKPTIVTCAENIPTTAISTLPTTSMKPITTTNKMEPYCKIRPFVEKLSFK